MDFKLQYQEFNRVIAKEEVIQSSTSKVSTVAPVDTLDEEVIQSSTSKVSTGATPASASPTDNTGDHNCAKVVSTSAVCEGTRVKVMGVT